MRIVKYLAPHKIAALLIVCLLAVQAFCDLSLPRYTSDIVDVGIQQKGVEHAAPDELSANTYDLVSMLLTGEDEALFKASYSSSIDGNYVLNRSGEQNRDTLDSVMETPMVVVHYASQIPGLDLDQMKQAFDAGTLTKQDIQNAINKAKESLGDTADSLIGQQAISAATDEYTALGVDMNQKQLDYLLHCGGMMLALSALGMLASISVGFIAARTSAKIGFDLRSKLFSKVVSFSDAEVQSFSAASLITRGTNDIQQIQLMSVMMLRMVLYAPILALGGVIMVVQTDLSMGWIVACAVVFIGIVIVALMKIAMPKFKLMQKLIDRVNLVSRETLTGLFVIRAFGREQFEEQRFDAANLHLMKTQLFTNRVMTFMMPMMTLVMNVVSVSIIWFGGHAVDAGAVQTGDLIAFISYSMVIIMGFLMIGMLAISLPRADVAAGRIDEVLNCEPSISDPAPEQTLDSKLPTQAEGATITFNDVSFKYADGAENVLSHISFTAHPGETTAIIGSTGSGKSTILKLIERFYDVSEGNITLDGVDIRKLSQHTLRQQLGYVPQKAFLFSGTIESNVSYACDDMPKSRVEHALDIAQASDFVSEKPEGLQTEISQGGTNVSGGQRQRLAIARALASNARAFLFDDSFSALDYKTDAALRERLKAELGGRTIIIVAQRISTVLGADQILVLDDGEIVGAGTHEELIKTCKEYQEIALSQLSAKELAGGGLQ